MSPDNSHWSQELMNPKPESGVLEIQTEHFTDEASLRSALGQQSWDGWWCLASEIHEGCSTQLPSGPILSGEGLDGQGDSVHLRRDGTGWRLDRFHWQSDPAGPHRAVMEDRARIGGGSWRYRVVWRQQASQPWQPWVAPLMKFEREARS